MHPPEKNMPHLIGQDRAGLAGKHFGQKATGADSANIGGEVTAHEFRRPRLTSLACTCRASGTCPTCQAWAAILPAPPRLIVQKPAGHHAENQPDADGIWRKPAPSYAPCTSCGGLHVLVLPGVCPTCRQWSSLLGKLAAHGILETGFANYRGASVGAAQ